MSASQIKLSLDNAGVFHTSSVNREAAAKTSQVLQENHENYHIFFNQSGFHSKHTALPYISWECLTQNGRPYRTSHAYTVRPRGFR